MNNERRSAARHRVELPVYIRYGRRPFLGAHARELSANGMLMSVQSLILPVGTPIELEISCHGRGWLVPAVVMHGDNTGIGVVFREPQTELLQALTALADPPPPVATNVGGKALAL